MVGKGGAESQFRRCPGPAAGPAGPVDEFAVIARLRARFEAAARLRAPGGDVPPAGDTWIGDDAAVVGLAPGVRVLMATDLVVAGVHVDPDLSGPEDIGYKAMMVTVSDFAAMGARPAYALVSVAAPPGTDLDALGAGLAEAAGEVACVVVGGDLSESPVLVVSTAAVGVAEPGGAGPAAALGGPARPPALRDRAARPVGRRAADPPGDATRDGPTPGPGTWSGPTAVPWPGWPRVRRRGGPGHRRPSTCPTGWLADLTHLAEASGVGVDLDAVPVADGASREEALSRGRGLRAGGGHRMPRMTWWRRSPRRGLAPPLPIGVCTADVGRLTLEGDGLPPGGWRHRF